MAKKFTGELAKKRKRRMVGLLDSDPRRLQLEAEWQDEDNRKLVLLFEHYGTPFGNFPRLCLAMAEDFVPGFQDAKASGRPEKWNAWVAGVLVVEMERKIVKGDATKGISWAATQLAKQPHWKAFIEVRDGKGTLGPNPAEVLRTKYTEWKSKKFAKVLRDSYGYHLVNDDVAGWEKLAYDLVRNPITQ